MKSIWGAAGLDELRRAMQDGALLGFDFDGTLAPLVMQPARAHMRPATRAGLVRLAALAKCVVVSGRALGDLEQRVRGIPLHDVIGSHGIEPFFGAHRLAARAAAWRHDIGPQLAHIAEARLERKPYGLTVHYRGAHDPARVRRDIRRVTAPLEDARMIWGDAVVDLIPLGAPTKADAIAHVCRTTRLRHVVYVGDDTTDEDVFRAGIQQGWLTIRVGHRESSGARFFLRDQYEIDRLLDTLRDCASNGGGA
ncbi:MAG: trehalose-phosphatase [Gemmatimonadaceae bacterium]